MPRAGTRYVVVVAAGVLVLGVAAGGIAYLKRGASALAVAQDGPSALRYVPADAALVAFADVRAIMASDFRRQFHETDRSSDGQAEFLAATGIDIEHDIDEAVAALLPGDGVDESTGSGDASSTTADPNGLIVLSGRFDVAQIEALGRQRGTVTDYHGRTLATGKVGTRELAMAFIVPEVLAVGSARAVQRAIELSAGGGANVTSNDRLMELRTYVPAPSHTWVLLRLDDSNMTRYMPDAMFDRVPALVALAVSGHVSDGMRVSVTAEARDEDGGQDLRDVVQGFVALGRMQASARPELGVIIDSVQLGGTGAAATVTFDLPGDVVRRLQRQEPAASAPDQ